MPMGSVFELSTLCFLEALISHIVWEKAIPEEKMKERHADFSITDLARFFTDNLLRDLIKFKSFWVSSF